MATVRMTKRLRDRILYTAEDTSGLQKKLGACREIQSPEFDEAMQGAWIHPDLLEKIQAVPRVLLSWNRDDRRRPVAGFMSVTRDGDVTAIPVQHWHEATFWTTVPATVPVLGVRPPFNGAFTHAVGERGLRVVGNAYGGPVHILLCSETQDAYRIFVDKMNATTVVREELMLLRKTVEAATSFNTLKQCLEFWPALKEFVPEHIMAIHEAPSPKRSKAKPPHTPTLSEEAKARATAIAAKTRMNKGV